MSEITLNINGQEFEIDREILAGVATVLPGWEKYEGLFDAMLDLDSDFVDQAFIGNPRLHTDYFDQIWDKGKLSLCRLLCGNPIFVSNLSDEQAKDIMKRDDPAMLISLADLTELFCDEDECSCSDRLSDENCEKLIRHIQRNKNAAVRKAFIENENLENFPDDLYPDFKDAIIFDAEVCNYGNMTKEDIKLLNDAPLGLLVGLAQNIGAITSKKVREEIALKLAANEQSAIRLILAQNEDTPQATLKKLQKDEVEEIAMMARDTLENLE